MQLTATGREVALAGILERFLANVIDGLIVLVVNILLRMLLGVAPGVIAGLAVYLVYDVFFWTSTGQTPGKSVMSIKVVDAQTGNLPDVAQAVIRHIGYYVSGFVLLLGYLWAFFDANNQTWHDKMAGTLVIRAR
jgi:uncharacterized RDD family membrane protein YckC